MMPYNATTLWEHEDEIFSFFHDDYNLILLQSEQDDICRYMAIQLYFSNYRKVVLIDAIAGYINIVCVFIDALNALQRIEINFDRQQEIKDLGLLYFNLRCIYSIYHNAFFGFHHPLNLEDDSPIFP